MAFYVLPSNEKDLVSIWDLYLQNILIPSFDLRHPTANIDKKYALFTWIQIICLYKNLNEETTLSEYFIESPSIVDIINEALESQDFNYILNYRSLIYQLYSEINNKWRFQNSITCQENSHTTADKILAYSLQQVRLYESILSKTNIGNKIAINKFLLLNENKDDVLHNNSNVSGRKSILFEITIDVGTTTKPYAKVSNQQILITPCAIYDFQSVVFCRQYNLWNIKLKLCAQNDQNIHQYLEVLMKHKFANDSYIFGFTLYLFEEYQLATDYIFGSLKQYTRIDYSYLQLLQLLSDTIFYAYVDDIASSLRIIHLTLTTYKLCRMVNKENIIIAPIYFTLGNVFRRLKLFDKAISYYEKAQNNSLDYSISAFINIGYSHEMMFKYVKALAHYKSFSKYLEEILFIPKTNTIFRKNAKSIGRIQWKLFMYELKRFETRYEHHLFAEYNLTKPNTEPYPGIMTYYSKTLHKTLIELLVKHYYRSAIFNSKTVAALYSTFSQKYAIDRKIRFALNTRKIAINIRLKDSLCDINDLLIDYYSIATYYYINYRVKQVRNDTDKKDLHYADYYIKKAIRIQLDFLPHDHIFLAESYNLQAVIFTTLKQYHLALTYFTQAFSIYSKWVTNDHTKFSFLNKSIGITYLHKNEYAKAVKYLTEALINTKNTLHSVQIYKLLVLAYYHLHDEERAIEQIKIVTKIYRKNILLPDDPVVELLDIYLQDDQQYKFIELYQAVCSLVSMNHHLDFHQFTLDAEYLLYSKYNIDVPLHICAYDEYLFNADVYFLTVNYVNENNVLLSRICDYSQGKYFIYYKNLNNTVAFQQYIQRITKNNHSINRTIALIIPTILDYIDFHLTSTMQNIRIFTLDENYADDLYLQQLVNTIENWLKLQFRDPKQLIPWPDSFFNQNSTIEESNQKANAEALTTDNRSTTASTPQILNVPNLSSTQQNTEIIYFGTNLEVANVKQLLEIYDYARIINDSEQCIQLIVSMNNNQRIFLIVNDENEYDLLSEVKHKCTHTYFVNLHRFQIKNRAAFRKIFDKFDQLMRRLRTDIRMTYEDHFQFNIFSSSAQSIQQLDKKSAEFIWFHTLIDAIRHEKKVHLKSTKWYIIAKNYMLSKCRYEYSTNSVTLGKIDAFEETYVENDAIKWYTEDTFIYRLINKALRSNNIEEILYYRFFIADLYHQLHIICEEQFLDTNKVVTVYRGQGVSTNDFTILTQNIGNLITIKSFLSTSWDRDVALDFAIPQLGVPGVEAVLFEIELDTTIRQKPFASISEFTPMNENEVLLSMGFIFRVKLVRFDQSQHFWIIQLAMEPETHQIQELLKYTKENKSSSSLENVLYGMGEYRLALRFCQWFIAQSGNTEEELAECYQTMALIYKELQQYSDALACLKNATLNYFELLEIDPIIINRFRLASIYYTLSLIYLGKNSYHTSIFNSHLVLEQNKALAKEVFQLLQDNGPSKDLEYVREWQGNQDQLGRLYNNLATAYGSLNQYRAAYHYQSKGLDMQRKCLPQMHYHIGISFSNFGYLCKSMRDYQNALKYYEQAIEIFKFSRQETHFSISRTYDYIGEVYEINHDYPRALENYQNALKYEPNLSKTVTKLMNIARIYNKMNKYQQAISLSETAARLCIQHSLPMADIFSKAKNIMLRR
ncbi:unnamed protein product [Rotaria magnacalcarata]